jgi:lipopolysaccharide transport system ATP-binding protein
MGVTSVAVLARGLGKRYRIGASRQRERHRTLRDTVTNALASVFLLGRERPGEDDTLIWALKDLSFEVKHGEVVGIIGRNGAGKSTLLKILSRIVEPTTGRAEVRGRVGSLLEIGTGFHPDLTGRENIYLNGAVLGMPRSEIRRRFDEIVAFSEMEQFLDTPVRYYSSGMYMRLAFSVAAHLEPDILVVDEVLAVGDAAFQRKCLGKMEDVSSQGRTVLFVSHSMPTITRLCPRVMLLDRGGLVYDGPVAEAVRLYMQEALGAQQSREWTDLETAPGTREVKLVSVAVTDEYGAPVSVASVAQPLRIKVGYYVGIPDLRFRVSVAVIREGTCAFTTAEPFEALREDLGIYYSEVTIPGHLLAEGDHSIDVSIYSSRRVKTRHAKAKSALTLHVFDPVDGTTARGDYAEAYRGVVRPKLEWETHFGGAREMVSREGQRV